MKNHTDPLYHKYKNIHEVNALNPTEKHELISRSFRLIMETMGLNLEDDSLRGTPNRVAKMFLREVFWGLSPYNFPRITTVLNKFEYDQMLVEKKIDVKSFCEHHFVPIIGHAHVAYIPKKKVIGLSKINRIVDYYARRPQIQERLTQQIMECLQIILDTQDVAVTIDVAHYCVRMRGIQHNESETRTTALGGSFKTCPHTRTEYFNSLN